VDHELLAKLDFYGTEGTFSDWLTFIWTLDIKE
jgi:hypothetical protein